MQLLLTLFYTGNGGKHPDGANRRHGQCSGEYLWIPLWKILLSCTL